MHCTDSTAESQLSGAVGTVSISETQKFSRLDIWRHELRRKLDCNVEEKVVVVKNWSCNRSFNYSNFFYFLDIRPPKISFLTLPLGDSKLLHLFHLTEACYKHWTMHWNMLVAVLQHLEEVLLVSGYIDLKNVREENYCFLVTIGRI